MILRDYQLDCLDRVREAFTRVPSVLAVLATGLGKTVIFSHAAKDYVDRGRVLILAHREELLAQAGQKVEAIVGIKPDLEMADSRADCGFFKSPVVLTSVQTQVAGTNGRRRMHRFDPSDFALLVVDEAHHAAADTYRAVISHYRENPNLKVLGVTATPDRHDEKALGQVFDEVPFDYGIADGVRDGWLVDIRQQFVEIAGLDFSACRTTAGDLNQRDLAQVMEDEKSLHGVASATMELYGGKRTLVFASSVAHGERLADIMGRHVHGCARFVHGGTDRETRRRTIDAYRAGAFPILVNVGIAVEGFDVPEVAVVVIARPTRSRSLYSQMCGRGTRPDAACIAGVDAPEVRRAAIASSSKPELAVIDFVGEPGRHPLVHCADVLGGHYSEAVVELAERLAKSRGSSRIREVLAEAEHLERNRRELMALASRANVRAKATYNVTTVRPFDVLNLQPRRERGWEEGRKASLSQIEFLAKAGVEEPEMLTLAEASQLVDEIVDRRRDGRCTFKQARLLRKYGRDPNMSFEDARRTIDGIAANGWRRTGT